MSQPRLCNWCLACFRQHVVAADVTAPESSKRYSSELTSRSAIRTPEHLRVCAHARMRRLSHDRTARVVGRGHALADVTRVRILDVLARSELPVGRIAAALHTQPSTVSKHLQVLFREGLVVRRRDASTVIYSIADRQLHEWCWYLASAHLRTRST